MAPRLRIGSAVADCVEFEKTVRFWQEALGYEPREPPAGGWVVLRDPKGGGPNLSFNTVRRKTPGRNNHPVGNLFCVVQLPKRSR